MKITINPTPSESTVVLEQVGPLDPLSIVGQAQRLTDFFDGGFNASPFVVLPPGGAVRATAGPGAGVHFINPALILF